MILIMLMTHCFVFFLLFHYFAQMKGTKLLKILNFLMPNTKAGQKLYEEILALGCEGVHKNLISYLTEYKFYTELVKDLIKSAVKFGTKFQLYLPEIKQGLIKDMQFEKKLFGVFIGGLYQMLMVFFLGGALIFALRVQFRVPLKFSLLLAPFILQFVGVTLFVFIFYYLKKQRFLAINHYLLKFYQMRTLFQAQLSLKELASQLGVKKLSEKGELKYFKKRLLIVLENIRLTGQMDFKELDLYINELWQLKDLRLEIFSKELSAVKLAILCLFSLGGYLILLFISFSHLGL